MKRPISRLILSVAPVFLLPFAAMATASATTVDENPTTDISFETTEPYYHPQVAVVPASTPIRWINSTASAHSVRHDGCLTDGACAFQSIAVPPDSSFVIAPLSPGRYSYHCELHPIMRGTLVVVDPQTRHEGEISLAESASEQAGGRHDF